MDDEIGFLKIQEIECLVVESEKTFALYSDRKKYLIRKRLYELEGILPDIFERISKSAIANWNKIIKFNVQLSDAVDAVFKSGYTECISRRCFAELKRRYGTMKKYIKQFCMRGLMWAWGGPVIMAIVWMALQGAGVITALSVREAVLGIFTITLMAFIAAGITIVYQIETLPKAFAGLIHAAVLYIDYLGIYLINGWIPINRIWVFSVIFVGCFAVIWLIIYLSVKLKVDRMNKAIGSK